MNLSKGGRSCHEPQFRLVSSMKLERSVHRNFKKGFKRDCFRFLLCLLLVLVVFGVGLLLLLLFLGGGKGLIVCLFVFLKGNSVLCELENTKHLQPCWPSHIWKYHHWYLFYLCFPVLLMFKLCHRATRKKHRSWLNSHHLKLFSGKKEKKGEKCAPKLLILFPCPGQTQTAANWESQHYRHYYTITEDAELSSSVAPRMLAWQHLKGDGTRSSVTPLPSGTLSVAFGHWLRPKGWNF